jgi:cyclic-di-GMP-binding protein
VPVVELAERVRIASGSPEQLGVRSRCLFVHVPSGCRVHPYIARGPSAVKLAARYGYPAAMAQSSFDIVSEVDIQEVRNAVDQAAREIHQRFDFKNTDTSLTLGEDKIEMHSATEDRLKAAYQVLQEKAVRREVPLKALQPGTVEPAAKGSVRQTISLVTGISDEKAKEISKFVRQSVPKAQTQIQGAQVRVTSKSKDDLQAAIRAVREHDFGIALQFTNYR